MDFLSLAKVLLLAVPLFISACSDQGCIEADDFGEYDQQTLTVTANNSSGSCDYNSNLDITDANQGSGVKPCFVSGTVDITDSDNNTYHSDHGCFGFDDTHGGPSVKSQCIDQCVQNCLSSNTVSSTGVQPDWLPTTQKQQGQNIGVTLTPGAEISVSAIGTVTLSGTKQMPDTYVSARKPRLQSYDKDFNTEQRLDVRANTTKDFTFEGSWYDAADNDVNEGNVGGFISGGSPTDQDLMVYQYNGAQRLAAYLLSRDGYSFDSSKTDEKAGTIGVPLVADTDLWGCSYKGGSASDLTQADCSSGAYDQSSGYTGAIDTDKSASTYYITNKNKAANLGKIGGMIRWDGDGLVPDSDDPFATAGCTGTSGCSVSQEKGQFVSNGAVVRADTGSAVTVKFKIISQVAASTCNLTYDIIDANGKLIVDEQTTSVYNNSWSGNSGVVGMPIVLEAGDQLKITANSGCPTATAAKKAKVQDIPIQVSGVVYFTTMAQLGGGNCTIKGRIVNPSGDRVNFPPDTKQYAADIYEYDFDKDPLASLAVSSSIKIGSTGYVKSWDSSGAVYLRKGQVLRLLPESWNLTFTADASVIRQCGIGMAIKIEERPALLCRGKNMSDVPNPKCMLTQDDKGETVCQRYAAECYDSTDSAHYCPSQQCQDAYDENAALCSNLSKNSCQACSALMDAAASQTPTIEASIAACYDLENYKGRVSNINHALGFNNTELDNAAIAKGAQLLDKFNGIYGNFKNFSDTGKTDNIAASGATNNIKILKLNSPLIFSKSGRLKFIILDDEDFQSVASPTGTIAYSANSPTSGSSSFDGKNGYKVSLSGKQEFNNGDMLEVILCQETTETNLTCGSTDVPPSITNQPEVVRVNFNGLESLSKTFYKFDDYGSLVRISNIGVTTPEPVGDSFVAIGSPFYKHAYPSLPTDDQLKSMTDADKTARDNIIKKLRLTFRIKDSDKPNCIPDNPLLTACDPSTDTKCTGLVMENSFYIQGIDSANGVSNDNNICPVGSAPGQNGCHRQFFCGNVYANNSGSYKVQVRVKNKTSNISNMVDGVVTPVVEILDGKESNCNTDNPMKIVNGIPQINTDIYLNGVKATNPSYDSNNGQNIGDVCSLKEYQTADPTKSNPNNFVSNCKKQFYCSNNNAGQAERIYKLLITDARYLAILRISLVVMITFYGVGYLMGVSEFSQTELIGRLIKIGVIYSFVGPNGWDMFDRFFVQFFKNGTDYLAFVMSTSFDSSPEIQQAIDGYNFHDKSVLFTSVDKVFGLFFSSAVQKKIAALLFASIFGWAYLLLIYWGFIAYVYAVGNAILLYLTAQIFISILFVLGPIFFIFLLFGQTKEMFDKWLSQLISFSLQQIFLLTTLSFFNMMMYEVMKLSLGYRVCWDDVWVINIITRIKLLSFWTVASMPPRLNAQTGVGNVSSTSIPSIFSIMFIWIIASLMKKFVTFMTDLASSMSDGMKLTELGAGVRGAFETVAGKMGALTKKAWDSSGGKVLSSVDDVLFDSGAKADERRKKEKAANQKTMNDKSAMFNAGEQAVSDYKKKNPTLVTDKTKSKEEIEKILEDVRQKGMVDKGLKLGYDEAGAKKLINEDKGFKYVGNNVFGAGLMAAKQMLSSSDGFKTLASRKAESDYTQDEVTAAAANMDKEERAAFLQGAKEGKFEVRRGMFQNTMRELRRGVGANMKSAGETVRDYIPKADKEYDEALQQLVDEGSLKEQPHGTAWSMSSKDKKAVRDRVEKNRDARKSKTALNRDEGISAVQEAMEDANREDDNPTSDWDKFKNSINPARAVRRFDERNKRVYGNEGFNKGLGGEVKEIDATDSDYDALQILNVGDENAQAAIRDDKRNLARRRDKTTSRIVNDNE